MNRSRKELEERLAAAEKILRDLEKSLAATKRMISEAHEILGTASGTARNRHREGQEVQVARSAQCRQECRGPG